MTATQLETLRTLAAELLEHLDGTQTHDTGTQRAYLALLVANMAQTVGER